MSGPPGTSAVTVGSETTVAPTSPLATVEADGPGPAAEGVAGETPMTQLGGGIAGDHLDDSGTSLALSTDGNLLAIGAPRPVGDGPGLVRVYAWSGSSWTLHGAPVVDDAEMAQFGASVALSADGRRLAVGAPFSDEYRGHVSVFDWRDDTSSWVQIGDDLRTHHQAGISIALSALGDRLAVGAVGGRVVVFDWDAKIATWRPVGAGIDPVVSPTSPHVSLSLSLRGDRLAIGAGASDPEHYGDSPAVLYEWSDSTGSWTQLGPWAPIDGADPGKRVALSARGERLVVGVPTFGPPWTSGPGRAFVFGWDEASGDWSRVGGELIGDSPSFGASVAIAANGGRIAIGDLLGGDTLQGRARVYDWDPIGVAWRPIGADLGGPQTFGGSLAFSGDGTRLAVGAPGEESAAGVRSGVTRVFEIATPSPTAPPPLELLPGTGAGTRWLRAGGLVLVVGGVLLLAAAGRGRRHA